MRRRPVVVLGGTLIAGLAAAAFVLLSLPGQNAAAVTDPRQDPPIVRLATATPATNSERSFTGIVGARVQSNLGFRVPGKIVERLVTDGQAVTAGEPLMRLDETDLELTLVAERNAVAVARAVLAPALADERRYASLLKSGLAASRQQYEQAKSTLDTAEAHLAAAEANARVAENQATYSVLAAGTDGTVIETLGEPGQVVSAGQTVVRIAHAGPREAVVALPETVRPAIGSVAEASVYGDDERRSPARLRQLSDAADPQTRTFEARYVLEGEASTAPLGATVTIRLSADETARQVQVPLGAVLDDGNRTGVWVFDHSSATVNFQPVTLVRLTSESAIVEGLGSGEAVVALGAHLLQEGTPVRTAADDGASR